MKVKCSSATQRRNSLASRISSAVYGRARWPSSSAIWTIFPRIARQSSTASRTSDKAVSTFALRVSSSVSSMRSISNRMIDSVFSPVPIDWSTPGRRTHHGHHRDG